MSYQQKIKDYKDIIQVYTKGIVAVEQKIHASRDDYEAYKLEKELIDLSISKREKEMRLSRLEDLIRREESAKTQEVSEDKLHNAYQKAMKNIPEALSNLKKVELKGNDKELFQKIKEAWSKKRIQSDPTRVVWAYEKLIEIFKQNHKS